MSQNTEKLEELQRLANSQQTELAKIEGRIDFLLEDLKKLGYSSVEDAKKALDQMNRKLAERTKVFNRKLNTFYKKYEHLIQKNNQ